MDAVGPPALKFGKILREVQPVTIELKFVTATVLNFGIVLSCEQLLNI